MFEPYPWLPLLRPVDVEMTLRLGLAFVLGAVIGWERESQNRPAGLRTHMLVGAGAAAFTIAGIYGFISEAENRDPARVAAQIVVGVGFLGAGTILRGQERIKGLTTAASVWVVAAVGVLAGSGLYFIAILTALAVFATLQWDPPRKRRGDLSHSDTDAPAQGIDDD